MLCEKKIDFSVFLSNFGRLSLTNFTCEGMSQPTLALFRKTWSKEFEVSLKYALLSFPSASTRNTIMVTKVENSQLMFFSFQTVLAQPTAKN